MRIFGVRSACPPLLERLKISVAPHINNISCELILTLPLGSAVVVSRFVGYSGFHGARRALERIGIV